VHEAAGEEGSVDGGDGKSKERRPSVGESLSRKNSLKAPLPRSDRGTAFLGLAVSAVDGPFLAGGLVVALAAHREASPALAPFLAKYDEYTGDDGKKQKVCVIGSGSWGTALARLDLALADPEADLVVKAAGRSPPNRQFLEVHRDSIACALLDTAF
jgi:hypothetical protein